jgi:hypothetical protein
VNAWDQLAECGWGQGQVEGGAISGCVSPVAGRYFWDVPTCRTNWRIIIHSSCNTPRCACEGGGGGVGMSVRSGVRGVLEEVSIVSGSSAAILYLGHVPSTPLARDRAAHARGRIDGRG